VDHGGWYDECYLWVHDESLYNKLCSSRPSLPFNIVRSAAFERMIKTATGNPDSTVFAASNLHKEHDLALSIKFLSVQHNAWMSRTTSGVIEASAAFIDHRWRFRHIALLAYMVFDITASARMVSELFDDSQQTVQCIASTYALHTVSDLRRTQERRRR
jgi:hypothetical protein